MRVIGVDPIRSMRHARTGLINISNTLCEQDSQLIIATALVIRLNVPAGFSSHSQIIFSIIFFFRILLCFFFFLIHWMSAAVRYELARSIRARLFSWPDNDRDLMKTLCPPPVLASRLALGLVLPFVDSLRSLFKSLSLPVNITKIICLVAYIVKITSIPRPRRASTVCQRRRYTNGPDRPRSVEGDRIIFNSSLSSLIIGTQD